MPINPTERAWSEAVERGDYTEADRLSAEAQEQFTRHQAYLAVYGRQALLGDAVSEQQPAL